MNPFQDHQQVLTGIEQKLVLNSIQNWIVTGNNSNEILLQLKLNVRWNWIEAGIAYYTKTQSFPKNCHLMR